ncbi:MAG: hypothetical protein ACREOM_12540 [Candidatus Dormibacteraceae bacterium]
MNRSSVIAMIATTFFVAACGSAASASNGAPSPTPSAGRAAFRNGTSGQLVQINGPTLILTGPNGDATVTYSSTTTITKTSTAALADIVVGTCAVATGTKDATGAITVTSVRLAPKTASGCTLGFGPNPGAGATPRPTTPRPSASPRPIPSGLANRSVVAGEVTAVSGTSVTILTTANGSQTITVPAAAAVMKSYAVTQADLQIGQCLVATGAKDAAGNVQATSLTITPAGPSGTCTTGAGRGRGGFGGGGVPGAGAPAGG